MREIKFRGKREDTGEWVYGDLIHRQIWREALQIWSEALLVIRVQDDGFDSYEEHKVIPETVGQYTGLKDMNGAEVYEDDLMKIYHPHCNVNGAAIIVFSYDYVGGWVVQEPGNTENKMSLGLHTHECWVVGNIHDNPELLEVEKK